MLHYNENKTIQMLLREIMVEIDDYESVITDFIVFYIKNKRHRYSKVAEYVNQIAIKDEQVVIFILLNIENILKYCRDNEDIVESKIHEVLKCENLNDNKFDLEKLIEKIITLKDHVELEKQRILFFQNKENKISSNLINKINSSVDKANDDMDLKVHEIQNNLTAGIISVLGIFAAIVMVFFGGINIFSNIISNIKDISKFRIVFMCSLVSMAMFDTIFLLLYSISKILDKDIGSSTWPPRIYSKDKNEYEFKLGKYKKASRYGIRKVFIRYPIVFCFNGLMLFIELSTFVLWYIFKQYSIKYLIIAGIGIIIFFILFYGFYCIVKNMAIHKKSKVKKQLDNYNNTTYKI